MPAYNFKQHFAVAVTSGEKCQTIRKPRKRPTVPGDTLYLYTGMRTKGVKKLREATCLAVLPITISLTSVTLEGAVLNEDAVSNLALRDGFSNSQAFYAFFEANHGLPFEGEVIKW